MLKNYLSKKFYFVITTILTFIELLWVIFSFCFTVLFYILGLIAFKDKKYPQRHNEDLSLSNTLYSPVNGRVLEIKEDGYCIFLKRKAKEIKIVLPWWRKAGIYLPSSGEIKNVGLQEGASHFRYAKHGGPIPFRHVVSLKDLQGHTIALGFLTCFFGGKTQLKVEPGDKGKQGAYIGHFPLGGTLFLYLPKKYEILVKKGGQVSVGREVIARPKGDS